jgi:membrane-associated phospholipid phosphatase
MISFIANIISFCFNPIILLVFMPFVLIYKTTNDLTAALLWTGYTVLFLFGMTAFVYYGVHKKIFTNMDVSQRTQRPLLFLVGFLVALFYLGGLILFHAPQLLQLITIGIIASVPLFALINTKIKASIHVATFSAIIIGLACVYKGYYFFTILLIPLIAWSRLRMKRHTLSETIAGGITGSLLSLMMYLILENIFHY